LLRPPRCQIIDSPCRDVYEHVEIDVLKEITRKKW